MTEDLPLWVVYDHPTDFPEHYVARQHVVGIAGAQPTERVMMADSLGSIRTALANAGLVCIARNAEDDSKIVESWV